MEKITKHRMSLPLGVQTSGCLVIAEKAGIQAFLWRGHLARVLLVIAASACARPDRRRESRFKYVGKMPAVRDLSLPRRWESSKNGSETQFYG